MQCQTTGVAVGGSFANLPNVGSVFPRGEVGRPLEEKRSKKLTGMVGRDPETGLLKAIEPCEFPIEQQRFIGSLENSFQEWFVFIRDLREARKNFVRSIHQVSDYGDGILFLDLSEPDLAYSVAKKNVHQPDPVVDWVDKVYETRGTIPHVTSFAFQYLFTLIDLISADVGGFVAKIESQKALTSQLEKVFPVHSKFDNIQIFERPNMIALLGSDPFSGGSETVIRVEVCKPVPRAYIPDFLWKLSLQDHWYHGFMSPPVQ